MDYDRRAAVNFNQMVRKPAEADEALGAAYRALVNFKLGMDEMEEIPSHLMPLYKQARQAIDKIAACRQETNQLREMSRRVLSR